jgi:guanylate kinase
VYTGCAGVGKGTVMKNILAKEDSFRLSVSATTRNPRKGEVNGREYFFVTKDEFKAMIEKDEFLEHACYVDNFYGTPKKAVEDMLNSGYNVFLEIEVQGGVQVKKLCPDCLSIFIVPPSMEELESRLRGRGTETEDVILKRMETAKGEMKYKNSYDYVVMNDDIDRVADEIISIVKSEQEKRN